MRADIEQLRRLAMATNAALHRASWLGEWEVRVSDIECGDHVITRAKVCTNDLVIVECSTVVPGPHCRPGLVEEGQYSSLDTELVSAVTEIAKRVYREMRSSLRRDLEIARQSLEGALQ